MATKKGSTPAMPTASADIPNLDGLTTQNPPVGPNNIQGLILDTKLPDFKMSEIGTTGLKVSNGIVLEEPRVELRWPRNLITYREMSFDVTIASALSLFQLLITRVPWTVAPYDKENPDDVKKANFLKSCMDDMEESWKFFVRDITSMFIYGFAVVEKIYRRRDKESGSKYNDGLIGLKNLPIRSQDTIYRWLYSSDGRTLLGVEQRLLHTNNDFNYVQFYPTGRIPIPRNKFLLFRTDTSRNNPEGNSPLKGCYDAWKYKKTIEQSEAIGIVRNMNGMPHLQIPPKYMSADATPAEQQVYEYYKRVIRNIHANEQSGLITPLAYDPESKQHLFKFELMGVNGKTQNDIDAVIKRYDNKILMCLFADILKMGQDQVGSFALAGSKVDIMNLAITSYLEMIQDVLNTDLVAQLFDLNGWDLTRLPTFEYGRLEERDLQDFSAAIQRIKAVGLITPTPGNVNYVAETLGLPDRVDTNIEQEKLTDLLGAQQSKSGQGMNTPTGGLNGTASGVSSDDNSIANKENL